MIKLPIFLTIVLAAVISVLQAHTASANGRDPGVPLTELDVVATCKDQEDVEHTLIRPLVGGEPLLHVKIGSAFGEVPLARIQKIVIAPGSQGDPQDDYTRATFTIDGNEEGVLVQTKEEDESIFLTGETQMGLELRILLSDCRILTFNSSTATDAEIDDAYGDLDPQPLN